MCADNGQKSFNLGRLWMGEYVCVLYIWLNVHDASVQTDFISNMAGQYTSEDSSWNDKFLRVEIKYIHFHI